MLSSSKETIFLPKKGGGVQCPCTGLPTKDETSETTVWNLHCLGSIDFLLLGLLIVLKNDQKKLLFFVFSHNKILNFKHNFYKFTNVV